MEQESFYVEAQTAQKPKDEKPKDEKPKDEKPKEPKDEKPKDEKPKDEKPKDEKPKDEKPKDEKPKGMPMWQKVVAGVALALAIILLLYVVFKVIPKNTQQPAAAPVQPQQQVMGGAKKCLKHHVHRKNCKLGKAGKAWRGGGCGCGGVQASQY
ncbi:MAG: hypothetical protein EBU66_16930 [Bacteroidetes bacterium]|nr:hypothetical protein [Bacteroidota bacterium]